MSYVPYLVEVPSFFNRIDFWSMLLPGYIVVILSILLFYPRMMSNIPSFDLFSTVLIIVAGPAVGFLLQQVHGNLSFFKNWVLRRLEQKFDFMIDYSILKCVCNNYERSELDTADARMSFSISTAIGLLAIGISYPLSFLLLHIPFDDYSVFNNGANFNIKLYISGSIILVSAILLVRMMLESYYVYPRVILKMFKKYDNTCEYCDFHTLLKGELDYHTRKVHGKMNVPCVNAQETPTQLLDQANTKIGSTFNDNSPGQPERETMKEVLEEINEHRKIFGKDAAEVDYNSNDLCQFCGSRIDEFYFCACGGNLGVG